MELFSISIYTNHIIFYVKIAFQSFNILYVMGTGLIKF